MNLTLKNKSITTYLILLLAAGSMQAQEHLQARIGSKQGAIGSQKILVVTGARFSYKLVQRWINEYYKVNPSVQIIIESRGSSDPSKFDILAEVFEHENEIKKGREYLYIGRYAILPVATSNSAFAKIYTDKGLTTSLINQIYFHDIFADKESEKSVRAPFTVYTRLQRAGVPIVFTKYFGFEQKDIKGKAIAGGDEHLLKALLRDSTAVSYLPLPLIYDQQTRKLTAGLVVLPVDINGNDRVNEDEKFYHDLDIVIDKLESQAPKKIKNIPVEYLHLSIDKKNANPEAIDFLKWVNENGQTYLHEYGYLNRDVSSLEKERFNELVSNKSDKTKKN